MPHDEFVPYPGEQRHRVTVASLKSMVSHVSFWEQSPLPFEQSKIKFQNLVLKMCVQLVMLNGLNPPPNTV